MTFNKLKFISGIFTVGLGSISILLAIVFGVYDPKQFSEFAVISSLGGVVLAMLGNLIVQSTTDEPNSQNAARE